MILYFKKVIYVKIDELTSNMIFNNPSKVISIYVDENDKSTIDEIIEVISSFYEYSEISTSSCVYGEDYDITGYFQIDKFYNIEVSLKTELERVKGLRCLLYINTKYGNLK